MLRTNRSFLSTAYRDVCTVAFITILYHFFFSLKYNESELFVTVLLHIISRHYNKMGLIRELVNSSQAKVGTFSKGIQ